MRLVRGAIVESNRPESNGMTSPDSGDFATHVPPTSVSEAVVTPSTISSLPTAEPIDDRRASRDEELSGGSVEVEAVTED